MIGSFNWLGVLDFLPELMTGLYYTLLISIVGLIVGFALGAIFGLGRISKNKLVYAISTVYIEVVRGTPVLVQAIWIFFALPLIIGYTLDSIVAGIIVIAINSGAYIAEIVRGAVRLSCQRTDGSRGFAYIKLQSTAFVLWS